LYVYGLCPETTVILVIEPVAFPQFAVDRTAFVVSITGSGLNVIVTCEDELPQPPTVSVTQKEVVPVTPVGVNGLPVPANVVNAASEYQLITPPLFVTEIGFTVDPAQYGAGLVTERGAGKGLMVKTMLSTTAGQVPAGSSVVKYNVTAPAVLSAAEGV
jgi:hypothetical protein